MRSFVPNGLVVDFESAVRARAVRACWAMAGSNKGSPLRKVRRRREPVEVVAGGFSFADMRIFLTTIGALA
jgi:hypothetical protein